MSIPVKQAKRYRLENPGKNFNSFNAVVAAIYDYYYYCQLQLAVEIKIKWNINIIK